LHGINGETQYNGKGRVNVKEKNKIEGEEDDNKTEKMKETQG